MKPPRVMAQEKTSGTNKGGTNQDPGYQYLLKFVLAGSSGVGKTSLLMRYVDECFSETFISTIGVDFKIKTETVLGARVKLQMWDTAGQDRFRSVAANFYRCADAIIIVFDVASAESFAEVEGWVAEARRYGPDHCRGLLVGNKADGEEGKLPPRQVDEAAARGLAQRLGMRYIEASAKTGRNVEEVFTSIAEELVVKKREENYGQDPLSGAEARGVKITSSSHRPVEQESFWCYGGPGTCSAV